MSQRISNSRDTIIDEIHHTRQKITEKFGGDIAAILDDARKRQAASGREVWKPSTRESAPESNRPSADP